MLTYRTQEGIGCIAADAGSGAPGAGELRELAAFLADPSLVGVVVEAPWADAAFLQAIAVAQIPVAAVGDGEVAGVCPFRFASRAEAEHFLKDLTAGRTPRLVRTAMTAIDNALCLPHEQALAEETRLFCDLIGRPESGGE